MATVFCGNVSMEILLPATGSWHQAAGFNTPESKGEGRMLTCPQQ